MLIIDDNRTCPTCGAYLEAPGYYCANGHPQPKAQAASSPDAPSKQPHDGELRKVIESNRAPSRPLRFRYDLETPSSFENATRNGP